MLDLHSLNQPTRPAVTRAVLATAVVCGVVVTVAAALAVAVWMGYLLGPWS